MVPVVRAKTFLIKSPEQWDAITSPVRLELIYDLHIGGPLSIAEMAARLDRPADSLYHHVRKLLAAGVFVEAGTRRVGKQTETVYDFVADRLLFDFDPKTGRNGARWKALGQMVLRKTDRAMCEAIDHAGLTIEGPEKDIWSRMDTAWLTPAELTAVNEHLVAVERIFAASRAKRNPIVGGDAVVPSSEGTSRPPGAESKLFYLSLFMMPAVRSRRAGARGVSRAGVRTNIHSRSSEAEVHKESSNAS
jgi:hypothetical protein